MFELLVSETFGVKTISALFFAFQTFLMLFIEKIAQRSSCYFFKLFAQAEVKHSMILQPFGGIPSRNFFRFCISWDEIRIAYSSRSKRQFVFHLLKGERRLLTCQ